MTRMRAVDAAVLILAKEGVTKAFGVPGAAINPLYSALKDFGKIDHILARHVEAASHMAEGYTRAKAGNIGVCLGTSGPAGTDMITGLYSATADSIPILCITGQAPVAKLDKEDFQGFDIPAIAKPVTKMAKTVLEGAQVPGVFQRAFELMRSGRPGPVLIDLPIDVQLQEIEFDIDAYEPLPIAKPAMNEYQADTVMGMIAASQHPILLAGGGIINADAADKLVELAELLNVPVISTLMGWGVIPDDHRLAHGMAGIQTSLRYSNATMLESDLVIGIGNRWANRMTGDLTVFREGRKFVHIDIEPTQLGRVFPPDFGVTSDAGLALDALLASAKRFQAKGEIPDFEVWVKDCDQRKGSMQRRTHFDNVPLKPQRVYEAMNQAFGKDTRYVTTIGLSQIQASQMLHVYKPRNWINAGQAGPLGWTMPAALGAVVADPETPVVALSGDYDFQFLIEELATAAQFNLPYVHVLVNNAYLGLIRQSQRAFDMDYQVQLSFDNINVPETEGYGVDFVGVAEALGCKAIRVRQPEDLVPAMCEARRLSMELRVPVVVECVLERVTNVSMGSSLANMTEFEVLAASPEDAPTAIIMMDPQTQD
ncbi:glyoxylate carboligase [Raineyella fluvialis]|uniref:Glyoxylate carboligase n=1 Tax=Raineyella fluvialis TaxID=2662261 RepID=A0A5Q2FCA7_9ACTN|nr:glyoxylate carboligase [Raineyella fluvialis]QGF23367.1 glyoxylate carboligase [Raineyella fluvialis]